PGPGKVINKVLHGCLPGQSSREGKRLEYETEPDGILSRVTGLRESLAGIAVVEVVHHCITDGPGVANGDSRGMGPELRRRRIRKLRSQTGQIVNDICANEKLLFWGKVKVKTCDMRIQRHWSRTVETEAGGIQESARSAVTGQSEVIGRVFGCSLCERGGRE